MPSCKRVTGSAEGHSRAIPLGIEGAGKGRRGPGAVRAAQPALRRDILKAGDIFSMDDVPIEVFAGGYRTGPDFPTITWTQDQLGKGIFYITRELNDRFTTVFT
jgi:hypothetical protein